MTVKKRVIRKVRVFVPRAVRKISGSVIIDGTEEKDYMMEFEVTNRVTIALSQAKVVLGNSSKRFSGKYSGGEEIEIKADYESGTTTLFKGRVITPKPSFDRIPTIEITAYDFAYEVAERRVTKKYTTATDIGQIVADLIADYAPGFTSTNVDTSTGITATPMWQDKKLWDCIKELAVYYGNNGYDFYCDTDKDWHFFAKGSRKTEDFPLVWGQSISRTKIDLNFTKKKNRIKVIGKSLDGQMLMTTKEDKTDQGNFWIMEDVIRDTNLTTIAECQNKADLLLSVRKNSGKNGTVFCKSGEVNIVAGSQTFISDPYNDLNDYFNISEVKHILKNVFTTEVKFYEYEPTDLTMNEVIAGGSKKEQEQLEVDNEFGMTQSYPISFRDDSSLDVSKTDGNVSVVNSRLVLGSGTTGDAVTVSQTATDNITQCVLKVNGSDYEDSSFYVSVNNGLTGTFEKVDPDELFTISGTGKILVIKVELTISSERHNPSIKSVGVLYK